LRGELQARIFATTSQFLATSEFGIMSPNDRKGFSKRKSFQFKDEMFQD
jgi:hypothetical protein